MENHDMPSLELVNHYSLSLKHPGMVRRAIRTNNQGSGQQICLDHNTNILNSYRV